ncbi:MAG TPA: 3'(2'),5'-bisphosphate nucleotidase CysQ [Mycobacteriales bacterium]|jgi:3'(2'), 5'-bisphosphate nucleotidase|nr:3'(2'),5'-bisphosphate nucleotidase CysQ [Mycobacteriales bacterium]
MQTDPTTRPVGSVAGDAALCRQLADEAGAVLLRIRSEVGFGDPAALKAAGDRGAHAHLVTRLAELRPGDVVLSEEGADPAARLTADRVWIVDPLDGTREFGEEGRTDWAVHVALWAAGELVAGAVALPARGVTLATDVPPVVPPRADGPLRVAVSRSRPPAIVDALAAELGAELVPMGSAGMKVAAVVLGEVDAYVHAGGQYEWDSAAPVAVARAAGLHTSRVDGGALRYNQPDPLLPDLIVCAAPFAPAVLDAVRPTGETP